MDRRRDREKLRRWCVRKLMEDWTLRRVSEHARIPKSARAKLHSMNREAVSGSGFTETLLTGFLRLAVKEYVTPILRRELQMEVRFAQAER